MNTKERLSVLSCGTNAGLVIDDVAGGVFKDCGKGVEDFGFRGVGRGVIEMRPIVGSSSTMKAVGGGHDPFAAVYDVVWEGFMEFESENFAFGGSPREIFKEGVFDNFIAFTKDDFFGRKGMILNGVDPDLKVGVIEGGFDKEVVFDKKGAEGVEESGGIEVGGLGDGEGTVGVMKGGEMVFKKSLAEVRGVRGVGGTGLEFF